MGRVRERISSGLPEGTAGRVLLALVALGVLLRLIAIASLWPANDTLDDGYQLYAGNPFNDPQHPAGYGLIVAGLGHVSRSILLPVLIQHLCGIASALLFYAGTRRVSGSAWAGMLPAGIVLLNPDVILLEHSVMSETWAVLGSAAGLYAASRAMEPSPRRVRWAALAGALLAAAVTIRTAVLPVIPVVVLACFLSVRSPLRQWRTSLPAPAAVAAAAVVVLTLYATANSVFGPRFDIRPSPGWQLYGRVAQFAECSKFDPPPGTEVLCDSRPPSDRPGEYYYQFDPRAPAPKAFGRFGQHDDLVGEWANRALRAQPLDFLELAWRYLRAYWVPSTLPRGFGEPLDPELDISSSRPYVSPIVHANLERYYDHFEVRRFQPGLDGLRILQHVTRFGATFLAISTLLVLLGLFVGNRRSRIGVLLFGGSGLATLLFAALSVVYTGRYTVPLAAPMMAAAGIAIVSIWERFQPVVHREQSG